MNYVLSGLQGRTEGKVQRGNISTVSALFKSVTSDRIEDVASFQVQKTVKDSSLYSDNLPGIHKTIK